MYPVLAGPSGKQQVSFESVSKRTWNAYGIFSFEYAAGDVEIHFYDGSRIGITPDSNTVLYSPSAHGSPQVYNAKEALPEQVRQKLLLVPKAVQHLVLAPADPPPSKFTVLR